MGRVSAILLVAMLLLQPARSEQIEALNYSAFWIWPGVNITRAVASAEKIYILQGEKIYKDGRYTMAPRGANPHHIPEKEVWLVFRTTSIEWTLADFLFVTDTLYKWKSKGTNILGVQIDFDAPSLKLTQYGDYLLRLREHLPHAFKISITGLMDWAASGDVSIINGWNGLIDEIVIQTYQGHCTVSGYKKYLKSLDRLKVPFGVGVIENGYWDNEDTIMLNNIEAFQGIVVFLSNTDGPRCEV